MKTKFVLTLALLLGINASYWAQSASVPTDPQHPYVEVVVTQDKIWLLPDEAPMEKLPVQVVSADGKVVLQKVFSADTEDWSLDVTNLAAGKYKILIGSNQTEYLNKQGGSKGLL
jgi:hypothetical protein